MESAANWYGVSLWSDDGILELVVMVASSCEHRKITELYAFKWGILWCVNYISKSGEKNQIMNFHLKIK